jgi:hypothetical protein
LDADDAPIPKTFYEQVGDLVNGGAVKRTHRRHRKDLAVEKLDALFLLEDPRRGP